jgi:hypothetical protein
MATERKVLWKGNRSLVRVKFSTSFINEEAIAPEIHLSLSAVRGNKTSSDTSGEHMIVELQVKIGQKVPQTLMRIFHQKGLEFPRIRLQTPGEQLRA